jgi:D-glycero-alpha-D-manno-heptose-7-phosphate kinase
MIISRTPFRISFFGGGTDYPQWFNEHNGAILGTTINKYCYVMLHDGKSWNTFDLPTNAGLATSSAYTVGLLRACTELSKMTIAQLATTWEQDKMLGNVGSQDQYLCSLGGFHLLRFSKYGIRDTVLPPDTVNPLQDYLMLFDTHQYRRASDIVAHQLAHMKKNRNVLIQIVAMVDDGLDTIKKSDWVGFGKLLNQAWVLKKQLSKCISTSEVDAIYEGGIKVGAIGGKLLGGGGGGFIIFFVEPDKQESVRKALSELTYVPFKFEKEGTKVIYRD